MGQNQIYLRDIVNNGIRDFSDKLGRYTPTAVKDYWDLGAMIVAGFAFNDNGSEVFGDSRIPVMFISGLLGLSGAGDDTNRAYRNLYAGYASLAAFWARGRDVALSAEIGDYLVAAFLSFGSYDMDRQRIKNNAAHHESSQREGVTQPLEHILQ